jgi:hypothetical protein
LRSPDDDAAFAAVIQDLCLAFNRPYTPEVTRVFWESLKFASIFDVRRMAVKHRNTAKKFPTPKDLAPERAVAPAKPVVPDPVMSKWAVAANKILFQLAYLDKRRGFFPISKYPPMPKGGYGLPLHANIPKPLDSKIFDMVAMKADYVRMAEEAEANGQSWSHEEFRDLVYDGFEKALGIA